nr:MAG TPA: hypothetical protein [Caudoviricetes sp.]
MKYVILKKINNIWYATRNRYTAKELEIIVDKHYDDVVDFELINSGECQGLEDGVIIVRDDGRELKDNCVYLNDDLIKEDTKNNTGMVYCMIALWCFLAWLLGWMLSTCVIVLITIACNFDKISIKETVQEELHENHKARGMM